VQLRPPDAQVSPIVGHDQKPSRTTTSGHVPFGPDGCGIARPSGVCAAAITCSVVSPPDEPPAPGVGLGGGGVGFTTGGRRGRRQIAAVSDGATLSV